MHGAGRIKFSIPFMAPPQRIVKIKIKLIFSLCPGLGREGLTQVFEKNKINSHTLITETIMLLVQWSYFYILLR